MGVLFQLILAAMIVSLFVVSRPTKLALVVIVLVCLQEVQIAKIPLHGVTLFMGCLFLSELPNVVDNFHYLRRSRLMWIILLDYTILIYLGYYIWGFLIFSLTV